MVEDVVSQNCSSALAKRIGFVNRKRLMPCTRQPWTTLGRIARDFGERLLAEWIDVTQETGSKLRQFFTVLVIIMHVAIVFHIQWTLQYRDAYA